MLAWMTHRCTTSHLRTRTMGTKDAALRTTDAALVEEAADARAHVADAAGI